MYQKKNLIVVSLVNEVQQENLYYDLKKLSTELDTDNIIIILMKVSIR